MEKKIVLLDMDDVLADFTGEWVRRYNNDYDDNISKEQFERWNVAPFVKPECGDKIFEYFKQPGIYRHLEPLKGSQEGVKSLLEAGFEILLVTDSPEGCSYGSENNKGSNPADDKRAWVRDHFPMIPVSNIVMTSKKWYVMGDVLVDDKPSTVEKFMEIGRDVIVMEQPYNRYIDAPRAMNWKELVPMIKERLMR